MFEFLFGLVVFVLLVKWGGDKLKAWSDRWAQVEEPESETQETTRGEGIKTRVISAPEKVVPLVGRRTGGEFYWIDLLEGEIYKAHSNPYPERAVGPFESKDVALRFASLLPDKLRVDKLTEYYQQGITPELLRPQDVLRPMQYIKESSLGKGEYAIMRLALALLFVKALNHYCGAAVSEIQEADKVTELVYVLRVPEGTFKIKEDKVTYRPKGMTVEVPLADGWWTSEDSFRRAVEEAYDRARSYFAQTA